MLPDRDWVARRLRAARENCGITQQAAGEHLGLSRSLIAQIELGNRLVSSDELAKLAALYRRPTTDFSPPAERRDDDVVEQVFKVERSLPARLKPALEHIVSLCREAVALEKVLGRPPRTGPPQYGVAHSRNTADAIVQGEQVAEQERQRLGLGPGSPVGNVTDLVAQQGIRVAMLRLTEEICSIFMRDDSMGSLIVIRPDGIATGAEDTATLRFGLLHGYALALFEREQSVEVTTLGSSDELTRIRAEAFAGAFLLPRSGLEAAIAGLDKGRPSRRALSVFGLAAEEAAEVVVRSAPGSQTLTCHDVAVIARRFGASYEATVYRLRSLDLISKPETEDLLSDEAQRVAASATALLLEKTDGDRPSASDGAMALKAEVALLGIEAFRRQLIAKADLSSLATKLKISALTPAKLIGLAGAVL